MDKLFVEVYKRVNMDASNQEIDSRMAAIESVLENVTDEMVDVLVKIFAGREVENDAYNNFAEFFYEEDYSFDVNNKVEMSILAGYILHRLLDDKKEIGKVSILLASLNIVDRENKYPELYEEAQGVLFNLMCETRENIRDLKNVMLKTIDVKNLKAKYEEEEGIGGESFERLINIVINLDANVRSVREQNRILQIESKKYREESQILNWVIGEWCNTKERPLKDVKDKEIALTLGKELAQFVELFPGPYSAKAFLNKMLSKTNTSEKTMYSMADMVNEMDKNEKNDILEDFKENDISCFPIVKAIEMANKVEGVDEWYPLYKKEMGISPEIIVLESVDWAYQFYLENIARMEV